MSLEDEVFTLDELGYLGRGKSKHRPRNDPQLYGGEYPFVQTGDVKAANLYLKNYSGTYNDFGLAQSKLWKKGTLVITIAANIAETAVLGQDSCFPDSVVGFEPNEDKVNSFFIKYYIDHIKREMQSISQGTTQDNLSLEKLRTFKFKVPCKQSVDEITEVLLSYDNLIENNNRRIAILEEMAQSLYREWFVKFRFPGHEQSQMVESPLGLIPEGWDIKAFTDLASFMNGFAFKASHFSDDGLAVVKIPELRNGPTTKTPYCLKNTVPEKYLIQNGDLIFSWSGSFVIKEWTFGDALLNQHLFKVTPIEQDNKRFIEISLQAALPRMLNQSVGATMKHIRRSTLTETKTIVPPIDLLSIFNEQVNSLINLAVNLEKKNQNLKKQRDLLLPKLISGQINLSQAEQASA